MIVEKGLYGLKTSSARFHETLSAKLRSMGFTPSRTDADLWMRRVDDHYEYIATYVDDLMVFSRQPVPIIEEIKKDYILKGIGEPEYYLGGNVVDLDPAWKQQGVTTGLSAETYITNVVEKLQEMVGSKFPTKYDSPMSETYHPEEDDTPLLSPREASMYSAFIGSANWVVSLGRMDVAYATNTLARFSMAPRQGHLNAATRVFGYLWKRRHGMIVVDPNPPNWEKYVCEEYQTWQEFYPDAEETVPDNMPEALGKKARITVYVDADHAHDKVTRRSVTGAVLFVNNTPVKWISKRQKTVETSTYGSEMVAARIATELIMEYRYSLRMLGVPLDGPALLLGDNLSVILNTTVPSSMLKKKHQACNYHRVREAVAAKIMAFCHIDSKDNLSDLLTKPLSAAQHMALARKLVFRRPVEYRTGT